MHESFGKRALKKSPEIFNTDQGVQFTSLLEKRGIKISMDAKGRALDNVFVERLWRSVKYEDIYLKGYDSLKAVRQGLQKYFVFYNENDPIKGSSIEHQRRFTLQSRHSSLHTEAARGLAPCLIPLKGSLPFANPKGAKMSFETCEVLSLDIEIFGLDPSDHYRP